MYDIRGTVPLVDRAAKDAIKALLGGICAHHGEVKNVTHHSFEFTSPFVQFNWNLLAAVSFGAISINEKEQFPSIEYRLSLFRVRVICTLMSIGSVVSPLAAGVPGILPLFAPIGLVITWGWVYGMNRLLVSARFRCFVEKSVCDGESQEHQKWIDARKKYKLSHAQIQMSRELGMNPKRFGEHNNLHQERWKLPLGEFIEECYLKRFGHLPDKVLSIEDRIKLEAEEKAQKRKRILFEKTDSRPSG